MRPPRRRILHFADCQWLLALVATAGFATGLAFDVRAQDIEQWRVSAHIVGTMYEFAALRARDKYCPVQSQDYRAQCFREFDELISDTRNLSELESEEMAEPYRKELQRRLFGLIVFFKFEDH